MPATGKGPMSQKESVRLRSQQLGRLETMPIVSVWVSVWVSVCVLASEYHAELLTSRIRGL